MAPYSRTVRLNWTYRASGMDRGQTGTPWPTSIGPTERVTKRGPRGRNPAGREGVEAIMAGFVVAATIALFLVGVMVGVTAMVAVAVHREDRRYTLAREAPDRLSSSTRRLNGLGRRDLDDEFLRPAVKLVHQ